MLHIDLPGCHHFPACLLQWVWREYHNHKYRSIDWPNMLETQKSLSGLRSHILTDPHTGRPDGRLSTGVPNGCLNARAASLLAATSPWWERPNGCLNALAASSLAARSPWWERPNGRFTTLAAASSSWREIHYTGPKNDLPIFIFYIYLYIFS